MQPLWETAWPYLFILRTHVGMQVTHRSILIVMTVLLVVFQNCELSRVSSPRRIRMDKLWQMCIMEHYTRVKRDQVLLCATAQTNHISSVGQEKHSYCIILPTYC